MISPVLRRNAIVILSLRAGMSMSARTARSGFWPPTAFTCSVRQTTDPTYSLPLLSKGSSSYNTARWPEFDGQGSGDLPITLDLPVSERAKNFPDTRAN